MRVFVFVCVCVRVCVCVCVCVCACVRAFSGKILESDSSSIFFFASLVFPGCVRARIEECYLYPFSFLPPPHTHTIHNPPPAPPNTQGHTSLEAAEYRRDVVCDHELGEPVIPHTNSSAQVRPLDLFFWGGGNDKSLF